MTIAEQPPDDFCYSCGKREPLDGTEYRVCLECGHAYRTATDLVDMDNAVALYLTGMIRSGIDDVHKITFCPLCLHDW